MKTIKEMKTSITICKMDDDNCEGCAYQEHQDKPLANKCYIRLLEDIIDAFKQMPDDFFDQLIAAKIEEPKEEETKE